MTFLVDTNVVSELARPSPNAGVVEWSGHVTRIALSAITVEELYFGLSWRPNVRVSTWLAAFIEAHCEVLPVDDAIAARAGHLRGDLRAQGETRTQADMLIAATATLHGLTLVTRNDRDFSGCRIPVLNPFSS